MVICKICTLLKMCTLLLQSLLQVSSEENLTCYFIKKIIIAPVSAALNRKSTANAVKKKYVTEDFIIGSINKMNQLVFSQATYLLSVR